VVWDPPYIRMVLDGFGISLVWIIGSSLLVYSFVLYGATTIVLCGATTLVLCGITTIVLCETQHHLWLPFHLIGWFGLWISFGSSGFLIHFSLLMN
jgi:hypothetical protein